MCAHGGTAAPGAAGCVQGALNAVLLVALAGQAQLRLLPRAAPTARAPEAPPEKTVTRGIHMGPSQGGSELFCCTGETNLRITVK